MVEIVYQALSNTLSPGNLLAIFFGTIIGIVVGIIPGIGPMVGMVILLPFTYSLPPDIALTLLIGVFCGGYFGGSIPAILMRTPGVPSAAVTALDGYPLSQNGQAQMALSAAIVGSFSGGIISVLMLMMMAPALAHVAASFSSPEFCMVGIFGIVVILAINRKQLVRGVLLLCLGLWFSTIGIDPATLVPRFDFGILQMQNGLDVAPVCLGFFAIGQSLLLLERQTLQTESLLLTRRTIDFSKIRQAFRYRLTLLKSSVIGTVAGLIPGPGSITAAFFAYAEAKRSSKNPKTFGKGNPEGCLAAEAGNNAVPAGTLIPLLTLGIPGDIIAALLLVIFTINGIYPGPLLLVKEPVLIYTLYFSMFLINVIGFGVLALFLRPFAIVTKLPTPPLAISVMAISLLGIYSMNLKLFDVSVAIAMGVLGYIMLRLDWPILPFVLGLVLGPIIEEKMRQSLSMSGGNPAIFITRPISLAFVVACLLVVVVPIIFQLSKKTNMDLKK